MVFKPDPVAGYRIDARQRIIGSGEQPVSPLVNDDENDVVGRLADGRLALRSLRCGNGHESYSAEEQEISDSSFHCRLTCGRKGSISAMERPSGQEDLETSLAGDASATPEIFFLRLQRRRLAVNGCVLLRQT